MLNQVLLKRTVLLTDHTTDEAFRGRDHRRRRRGKLGDPRNFGP